MGAGDLAVSIVGTYATMAAAVVALDAGNDALATDHHDLYILDGIGGANFVVVKYARATA